MTKQPDPAPTSVDEPGSSGLLATLRRFYACERRAFARMLGLRPPSGDCR